MDNNKYGWKKVTCFNIPLPETGPEDETSAIVLVVCYDSHYNIIQASVC